VRYACLFLFSFLCCAPLGAQPAPGQAAPTRLSLEDALAIAEAKSEQITIARAGITRADGDKLRARSDRFPQLSLSASYDRTLASEFDDLFTDFGGDAADGDGTSFEDLPFGRKNIWRLNLAFSQSLWTGGRIGAQEAIAEAGRSTAEIALASARAQLALDVVRAYYDGALSDRLVAIADATFKQADAVLRQAQVSFRAGAVPEFDQLRAQVTRDNQRPIVIRRRSDRDLAYLRLKQMLELPADAQLQLTTALDDDALLPPLRFAETTAKAETNLAGAASAPTVARATVRQAETVVQARDASIDVARAGRRPTVSLTSSYGRVTYPSGVLPDLTDLRTNWTIGVVAQMPILTGGRLRADELVARADKQEAEARLQQARELAELDTRSAYEELTAARASWEASAGTVTQAARAHEIAEIRYRQGISTQLELSDARLLYEQAQANRAQAARDLQVARARIALLPDLPLSAPGTLPPLQGPLAPALPAPLGRPPTTPGVRAASAATGDVRQ
jgi:outer membrane protein TolC